MTWFDKLTPEQRLMLQSRLNTHMASPVREFAGDDAGFGCWLLVAVSAYYIRFPSGELVVPEAPWRARYDKGLSPLDALDAVP